MNKFVGSFTTLFSSILKRTESCSCYDLLFNILTQIKFITIELNHGNRTTNWLRVRGKCWSRMNIFSEANIYFDLLSQCQFIFYLPIDFLCVWHGRYQLVTQCILTLILNWEKIFRDHSKVFIENFFTFMSLHLFSWKEINNSINWTEVSVPSIPF